MTLWRAVNLILGYIPALVAKLDRNQDDLTAIREEQARQAVILEKILFAVEPQAAVQLKLTLGKPIPQ